MMINPLNQNKALWVDSDFLEHCTPFSPNLNEARYYAELHEAMDLECVVRAEVYAVCTNQGLHKIAHIPNGIALRDYRKILEEGGGSHLGFYYAREKPKLDPTIADEALQLYAENILRPELWERSPQEEN